LTLRSPYVEVAPLGEQGPRVVQGIVGGCAVLLGVASPDVQRRNLLCGQLQHQHVLQVPYAWHKISDSALSSELKRATGGGAAGGCRWRTRPDTSRRRATSFLATADPFVFAESASSTRPRATSCRTTRCATFFSGDRQRAAERVAQGFPLTGFKQIRDQILSLDRACTGSGNVRVHFNGNVTDTFDEVALTNADQTVVYFLVLHCTAKCYSNEQTEINDVMSSFTIRSL